MMIALARRTKHIRHALALLVAGACLTGCDYVYNVTVPASDNTAPLAAPTIYLSGEYYWAENKTYTTSNPNAGWYALGAGFDSGGTKRVVIHREAFSTHKLGGNIAQSSTALLSPIVLTQGGSVGSTVKNGLWTVSWIRPSDYDLGGQGTLSSCGYRYWVEAEDFHGNKQTRNGGTFIYIP